MATQDTKEFVRWNLSKSEVLAGSALSGDTIRLLQNDVADATMQRLGLDYDPLNPVQFAQNEAFIKGQIAAFKFLIDRSDQSINLLNSGQN